MESHVHVTADEFRVLPAGHTCDRLVDERKSPLGVEAADPLPREVEHLVEPLLVVLELIDGGKQLNVSAAQRIPLATHRALPVDRDGGQAEEQENKAPRNGRVSDPLIVSNQTFEDWRRKPVCRRFRGCGSGLAQIFQTHDLTLEARGEESGNPQAEDGRD